MARGRARRIAGAGDHRPGLRDGIDAAFVVRRRAERRAVVEIGAPIPFAVPSFALERLLKRSGMRSPALARASCSPRASAIGAKAMSAACRNQPSQTLSPLPAFADAIHAVVPVAGAHQRQAVRAEREAVVERARAMLEQRRRFVGDRRAGSKLSCSLGLQRLAVEERHLFVEHGRVARGVDIVRGGVGQPDAIVGDARAHALARMAAATNAARRLRRTAAPQRAADARASGPAATARAPCRPAADRGSHRRRWPDRTPSAPRCGRRASDRAASR